MKLIDFRNMPEISTMRLSCFFFVFFLAEKMLIANYDYKTYFLENCILRKVSLIFPLEYARMGLAHVIKCVLNAPEQDL